MGLKITSPKNVLKNINKKYIHVKGVEYVEALHRPLLRRGEATSCFTRTPVNSERRKKRKKRKKKKRKVKAPFLKNHSERSISAGFDH